jgi:hypothetical protein
MHRASPTRPARATAFSDIVKKSFSATCYQGLLQDPGAGTLTLCIWLSLRGAGCSGRGKLS